MPWPYGSGPSRATPASIDRWLPPGARRLEHHSIDLPGEPGAALAAIEGVRLQDVPIVSALFALRRLPFQAEMTLLRFFGTSPFLVLEAAAGREMVFGVVGPFWQWRRGRRPGRVPATPDEFRAALADGCMAALGNFRVEPTAAGTRLWTETWVAAPRAGQKAAFLAYWLMVGPFSAWIRRLLLRAARRRALDAAVTRGR